jgi:hypothetical protein
VNIITTLPDEKTQVHTYRFASKILRFSSSSQLNRPQTSVPSYTSVQLTVFLSFPWDSDLESTKKKSWPPLRKPYFNLHQLRPHITPFPKASRDCINGDIDPKLVDALSRRNATMYTTLLSAIIITRKLVTSFAAPVLQAYS